MSEYREVRKVFSAEMQDELVRAWMRQEFPFIPDDAKWETESITNGREIEVRVIWEVEG
jgi:hypothetical protein